jgi:UDP-galactopyranose mutase
MNNNKLPTSHGDLTNDQIIEEAKKRQQTRSIRDLLEEQVKDNTYQLYRNEKEDYTQKDWDFFLEDEWKKYCKRTGI